MESPKDLYAEKFILGCCLIDNSLIGEIGDIILENDFYLSLNKDIFKVIKDSYANNKNIDIVSANNLLENNSDYKRNGGIKYLFEIQNIVDSVIGWKENAKSIKEKSILRQTLNISYNIQKDIDNKNLSSNEILDKVGQQVFAISNSTDTSSLRLVEKDLPKVMKDIEDLFTGVGKSQNILTGYNCIDKKIGGFGRGELVIIAGRPSMGKGIGLDKLILTNKGWVKNKDIKLGDKVIGRDGKETNVIGIFPQPLQDCYKITFKDGREVICDTPHEWTIKCKDKGVITTTTEDLYNKMQKIRYQGRISIPFFSGDYGIKKDFIIPPYILGVLIGDGCLTNNSIAYCKRNKKVFNNIKFFAPQKVDVHFQKHNKDMVSLTNWEEGRNYLKKVGLNTQSYNKFIPKEYFHSNKEQRELLLQGLLDTDGYYRQDSSYEYSTTSKQLAIDVQQLAWSLGYNCKIVSRLGKYKKNNKIIETRTNYRVYITKNKPLTIVKIEKTKPIPTQCIHVDNKDKLFVIEDYIVTHNSLVAMNIAENVALKGSCVAVFSLEMTRENLIKRTIASLSETNLYHLMYGGITERELTRINAITTDILPKISELMCIDTDSNINVFNIRARIRKVIQQMQKKNKKLDMIVIDYLQRMLGNENLKNRNLQIAEITRQLKNIALEFNIPVVCLSQLNRGNEQTGDKTPMLSNLRDSGAIEQDADKVIFIHREGYYHKEDESLKNSATLIVGKNRNGEVGNINLYFEPSIPKFKDIEY